MAERRMFSRSVVGSARFLKMPTPSRLLYYDLGMEADDDGFVEAFSVLRKTCATEEDLRVLALNAFVKVLNEDLVTYISDWKQNNFIRSDRYHPSQYKKLLCQIETGYSAGIPAVDQRYTEDSIGKVSIGKDSTEKGGNRGLRGKEPMTGLQDAYIPTEPRSAVDCCSSSDDFERYVRELMAQRQQNGSVMDSEKGDLYE